MIFRVFAHFLPLPEPRTPFSIAGRYRQPGGPAAAGCIFRGRLIGETESLNSADVGSEGEELEMESGDAAAVAVLNLAEQS
jgi:hypothetical protein